MPLIKKVEDKIYKTRKSAKITANLVRKIASIVMVALTLTLNGFMAFMPFPGMDFSRLGTSEYWINYMILTGSEMVILLSIYLIRKADNLLDDKIVKLRTVIDRYRRNLYIKHKSQLGSYWLRDFFNKREKLNLFEDEIIEIENKLVLDEPQVPVKPSEDDDKKHYKKVMKHYKRAVKQYERAKVQYEKDKEKYDWCEAQLKLVKKARLRLELIRLTFLEKSKDNKQDIKEEYIKDLAVKAEYLEKELVKENFAYSRFKLKYENVYWETLNSSEKEINFGRKTTAHFHEGSKISNKLKRFLFFSLIISTIFLSMLPAIFKPLGWEVILDLIIRTLLFIWSGIQGAFLADSNILYDYKAVLEIRLDIYVEMSEDLRLPLDIEKLEVEEPKRDEEGEVRVEDIRVPEDFKSDAIDMSIFDNPNLQN